MYATIVNNLLDNAFYDGYDYAQRMFAESSMDRHHREDVEENARKADRSNKVAGSVGLGLTGAALGGALGFDLSHKHHGRNALLGAAAGGTLGALGGYAIGRALGKKELKKAAKHLREYDDAETPEERKELRERYNRSRDMEGIRNAIYANGGYGYYGGGYHW